MIIKEEKITKEELIGKPRPSNNPIQSLVNQGTYILGIDDYPDDDVVPLEVKTVKDCLKIIVKRAMKTKRGKDEPNR